MQNELFQEIEIEELLNGEAEFQQLLDIMHEVEPSFDADHDTPMTRLMELS